MPGSSIRPHKLSDPMAWPLFPSTYPSPTFTSALLQPPWPPPGARSHCSCLLWKSRIHIAHSLKSPSLPSCSVPQSLNRIMELQETSIPLYPHFLPAISALLASHHPSLYSLDPMHVFQSLPSTACLLDFLQHLPVSPQACITHLCTCSASGSGMLNPWKKWNDRIYLCHNTHMHSDFPGPLLDIASTHLWLACSLVLYGNSSTPFLLPLSSCFHT